MQAVIVFLKLNFDLINIILKKFGPEFLVRRQRFHKNSSPNIVFLKLDFDLPHIIYRNLVVNFLQKSSANDVFLKRNHNFSYVISDTNEREGQKCKDT